MWSFKNWKTMFMLTILLPVGLLVSSKMTGIVKQPLTITERITADVVRWNMTRPSYSRNVNEMIQNCYSDGFIRINYSVLASSYSKDTEFWSSVDTDDVLGLQFYVDAMTSEGYVHSITLRFSVEDNHSAFFPNPTPVFLYLSSLNITRFDATAAEYGDEARVTATHFGFPLNVSMRVYGPWLLIVDDDVSTPWWYITHNDTVWYHAMSVSAEIVYTDGTVFRQVTVPIALEVFPN